MSTQLLLLGSEVTHKDKQYLVVGLVDAVHLFQTDNGCEKWEEKYAELKAQDGEITFMTLVQNSSPFTEKHSMIKALSSQPWREKI